MPGFANFGELREQILRETAKGANSSFDEQIPAFVQLAEARIFYGSGDPLKSEPVRTRSMETSANLSFTAGVATLPAGFLDKRNLYWPSNPISVPTYEPPMVFWPTQMQDNASPTYATTYTIEGSTVHLYPRLTGTAKLLYFAKPAALEANSDTNWILTTAPAVYFNAVLIEAYRYIRNAELMGAAYQNFMAAAAGLNAIEAHSRYSGGRLVRSAAW